MSDKSDKIPSDYRAAVEYIEELPDSQRNIHWSTRNNFWDSLETLRRTEK